MILKCFVAVEMARSYPPAAAPSCRRLSNNLSDRNVSSLLPSARVFIAVFAKGFPLVLHTDSRLRFLFSVKMFVDRVVY